MSLELPVVYLSRSEHGEGNKDKDDLQVTQNLSHSGFEATEDDHHLPTCLFLNLLDGQLDGG